MATVQRMPGRRGVAKAFALSVTCRGPDHNLSALVDEADAAIGEHERDVGSHPRRLLQPPAGVRRVLISVSVALATIVTGTAAASAAGISSTAVGSATTGSTASSATVKLAATGINVGDLVEVQASTNSGQALNISDSGKNRWTKISAPTSPGGGTASLFYTVATAAVAANTGTVTVSGPASATYEVQVTKSVAPHGWPSQPLDQSSNGGWVAALSPQVTPYTSPLKQADELLVGAYDTNSYGTAISASAGFTSAGSVTNTNANGHRLFMETQEVNSTGAVQGSLTQTATGSTSFFQIAAFNASVDTTAPSVPVNPVATPGDGRVSLSWTASSDNVGVAGYYVYRNGVRIAQTTSTSYTDSGLTDSRLYTYYMTASDAAGNVSAPSTQVTATPVDTTAPSAPASPVATGGDTQVAVSWAVSTDNVGVAGYDLYRNGVQIAQTTTSNYTDTGLTDGTSYAYYMRAYDGAGNTSASSMQVTATPASSTMAPTWTSSFANSWGAGTSNSYSSTKGWWGFDGSPNGFIGLQGWSFTNSHFSFATNPVLPGSSSSFKATVDSGAGTSGEAGQRTAVYMTPVDPSTTPMSTNPSGAYEGSDQWYHYHVYFPAGYSPEPNTSWNWFNEFHNYPNGPCCANISMGVVTDSEDGGAVDPNGRFSIRVIGGGNPSTPVTSSTNMGDSTTAAQYGGQLQWFKGPNLQLGHWYDVVVHVGWTYTKSGQVQVWLDGNEMVNYAGPTLYYYAENGSGGPGPGNDYWFAGNYRWGLRNGATDTQVDSIYHDDYMRGPTRSSVGG